MFFLVNGCSERGCCAVTAPVLPSSANPASSSAEACENCCTVVAILFLELLASSEGHAIQSAGPLLPGGTLSMSNEDESNTAVKYIRTILLVDELLVSDLDRLMLQGKTSQVRPTLTLTRRLSRLHFGTPNLC